MPPMVSWKDLLQFRLDPYLQKIYFFISYIIFFVLKPAASTHDLYPILFNHVAVSHRIFMIHFSLHDDGNNFHINVRMDAKAFTDLQLVVIKSNKRPEC